MEDVLLFIASFMIIYFIYSTFLIRRKKKYDEEKTPMEIKYFIKKYHLDMDRVNYLELVDRVSLWTSFDAALAISIASMINIVHLQIILGVVLLFGLITLTYRYIGKNYQKRGLIKHV